MSERVSIDSGAFIAFLDRADALQDEARTLFADLPRTWSTSVRVASETWAR